MFLNNLLVKYLVLWKTLEGVWWYKVGEGGKKW